MGEINPLAFFLAFAVVILLLGLVLVGMSEIRKYASRRHELEVRRDMVERGLSIDDIERVLAVKVAGDK